MLEAGEPGGLLASVEAFCCRHSTVQVADILAHFLDLPQALLDSHILPALIKAGVLQATAFTDKCVLPLYTLGLTTALSARDNQTIDFCTCRIHPRSALLCNFWNVCHFMCALRT